MKRLFSVFTLTAVLLIWANSAAQAQTGQLLGGNVLNGTITGTMLGAATMGLNNSGDLTPLRIGIGSGILGGAAVALYDVVTLPSGQQFYISGVFNDGRNSSIIILLDTFYGAAGGALLGAAITLIGNEPLLEGLQYGSGAGAWAGFGFGLLDSFVFAERNSDFVSQNIFNRSSLLQLKAGSLDVGIVQPALFEHTGFKSNTLYRNIEPGVKLISLSKTF